MLGAVRQLGMSRVQLKQMTQAQLRERLGAITGRDRLAEALKNAGAV